MSYIDLVTLSSLTALAAVVLGPLVQFVIGWRQTAAANLAAKAAMATANNTGNREIARMRLQWLHDLREVIADYHAILMSMDGDASPEDDRALSRLGTKIDLMLNREEEVQAKLWQLTDDVLKIENLEERQKMDEALMKAGRAVLKQEWNRIKAELQGTAVC